MSVVYIFKHVYFALWKKVYPITNQIPTLLGGQLHATSICYKQNQPVLETSFR